jgi:hypothetical protein
VFELKKTVHANVEEAVTQMRRGVAMLEPWNMLTGIERGIATELRVNTTLTELLLRINLISDAGAVSLAEALGVNTALTVLNLDNK